MSDNNHNSYVIIHPHQDSQLIRIHQVLPISRFEMKDKDLFLSQPFLEFLHQLPIDYNYALYSELFQLYGTHYYTAGTLGGHYDLLYMYNREEIKESGTRAPPSGQTWACCVCGRGVFFMHPQM